jgi:hypothetical protein
MLVKEIKVEKNVSDFSNYSRFDKMNRTPDMGHIKKLAVSFTKFGTAAAKVVVIKTKIFGAISYYIVDGQHTIEAVTLAGLSVDVTIVEMEDETRVGVTQYIAVLNNVKKGWSNKNYLRAFVANNKHEYIVFDNLIKAHKLTVTDLMNIFVGKADHKKFKDGTMKFNDEADGMELVKAFVAIKGMIPKKAFCTRNIPKVLRRNGNTNYKPFVDAVITANKGGVKFSENEKEFVSEITMLMDMAYASRMKVA